MQGDSISLVKKIRIYQTDCPISSFIVPLHAAALYAPQGKLRIRIHERPPVAPLFLERSQGPDEMEGARFLQDR